MPDPDRAGRAPLDASPAEPPIRVRELTRRFGDFVAVDRVTFEVRRGEIFGFLGPNGAGKTTTIKMLTGLIHPTSGEGRVAGFDIERERGRIQRSIGYMSQLFSLYEDLTVAENIRLFGGLYGVAGAELVERRSWILEMAGLEDAAGRAVGTLPLGFKQRLALGCAVLHRPPILILDEPTSGVDPLARRRFWDLIDGMAAAGTTVLVSTHYMEEAEYCHRLALMNRGRLVAVDEPAGLKTRMEHPLLRVRTDAPHRAVEAIRAAPGVVDAALFGRDLHVVVEDEAAGRTAVAEALAARGLAAPETERIRPSLEDVFVSLIRREGGAPA